MGEVRTLPETKKAEWDSLAMEFRQVDQRYYFGGFGGRQGLYQSAMAR